MTVIFPPDPIVIPENQKSVFLAGSIEMGKATDWQAEITELLKNENLSILNPRRKAWDSSWEQTLENPVFAGQVNWELEGLEKADAIVFYFSPGTQSPVTLLELGLFAKSGKIWVCCPVGFWRKGNVDVVCQRYRIPQVNNLQELAAKIKTIL